MLWMQVQTKFIGGNKNKNAEKYWAGGGGPSTLWSLQNSLCKRERLGEAELYE